MITAAGAQESRKTTPAALRQVGVILSVQYFAKVLTKEDKEK